MMVKPLVSIIIPVHNAEKHFEATINSALSQTWPNKEIIIVDDGSTDNSLLIAKSFESKIVKVFHQQNTGAAAARNKGINEANGEYIQFLDADDLLSNNKIEAQMKLLLGNPGKVAVCATIHFPTNEDAYKCAPSTHQNSFLFTTDDPVEFLINLYGGNDARGSMVQPNAWLTPSTVINKSGLWNQELTLDDDGEFFCRVLIASSGVVYTNEACNYYRKYQNGDSLSSVKTMKAVRAIYESFLLKERHLLAATTNIKANRALACRAMDIAVMAYPADKQLTAEILNNVRDLGGTDYIPILGGKLIELLKTMFGWKVARSLQHSYYKK